MESDTHSKELSWRILNTYHGRVYSLLDYLLMKSDASMHPEFIQFSRPQNLRSYLLRDPDSQAYRDLLMTSLVAESGVRRDVCVKLSAPSSSITEVIERAHARLFARSHKPSNVIATGYRSAELRAETWKGGAGGARQGVTNFFVNTLVTALQAPEWSLLLKRVGDAVLLHILTETSVYVALLNDCYCQLIGPPLIYETPRGRLHSKKITETTSSASAPEALVSSKREHPDKHDESNTRPSKRRKDDIEALRHTRREDSSLAFPAKNATASVIPLARVTMFYARADRRAGLGAHQGRIQLGLPTDHILNRMRAKDWRISKGLSEQNGEVKKDLRPGDRDGALEARHLSKYIFPLQYGLQNVFSAQAHQLRKEVFMRFYFTNREDEINMKGPVKTPPRLKGALSLLAQLHNRHAECGYKSILNTLCPSKLRPDHTDSMVDSSAILELISEDAAEDLQTQMNYTISTVTPLSVSFRQMKADAPSSGSGSVPKAQQALAKLKPKFAEFTCSYEEVYMFAHTVTNEIIPKALWGCEENRKSVFHHVKQMICARRIEGMTLHDVMQGISTSKCEWLIPSGKPSSSLNHSESEMVKRRELLQEFIFWYFDQFLLPLLRTTFYITDSAAYRNRVLYFRQDDWDVLCQPLLDRLVATTFERIQQHEAEELLQQRKLGYSFVRLRPKDSGVRPIVNLRRKKTKNTASDGPFQQGQSINQILSAAFQILGYEQKAQAEKLGASAFGPNESYPRLKAFKAKVVDASGKLPKLYFVKVDVQACFDTIEQSKLLEILKDLISEDVYMVQKYGQIMPSAGRVVRKYVRNAMPEYEHPHFLTHAKQLATLLRHAIFVDQVVYPFAFRDEIIQLLEDHITDNIVRIGKDYYRQRVGIPQGSVLSSLLCSFFYGDLERNILHFATDPSKANVLLRLIDDYLFITTDVQDARRFLEVMNQGHPEYGCFIAREKTLTNFDHRVGDISQHSLSTVMHPDRELFPWCGYLINTKDLSILTDYSRFHDNYLMDSLTVEQSRRPNAAFLHKMLQLSSAKTHVIFTDAAHNSSRAARINVYQSFVLTAMKMHAYIRAVRDNSGGLAFVPHSASSSSNSSGPARVGGSTTGEGEGRKKNDISRKALQGEGAFMLKVIRQCIRYTYACIRYKHIGDLARKSGAKCDLTQDEVTWLGTHAFHSILTIKRTAYAHAGVLNALHRDLVRPRFNPVKRRLAGIAKESLESMLRDIRF